ncbi:MAG: three-Cys-motif partner protein TcmP [Anaerolineales bacterium]|nr:three-Cys-motif partner protein TcmP [Anaerolineales bacterium]
MQQPDPKTHLLEHSEAKLKLYDTYLARYLNILARTPYVEKIFLFDLLCREGIYEKGEKGSPIMALETIKDHYYSNNRSCPNITIWFNDIGYSEIENDVLKIDRVKIFGEKIYRPSNVNVKFYQEDYQDLYPKAVQLVNSTYRAKGLFFIDPYGYKAIKPEDIRNMLDGNNTEVLLWLPASFMYRFANTVTRSDFKGGEPLKEFIIALFGKNHPLFKSVYDFIEQITGSFRAYLRELGIFVDSFTLERGGGNVYCLFFFTSHIKGYETMLATKWDMDENRGKGHTLNKFPSFSEIQLSGYPQKLKAFVSSAEYRTNAEIYKFGLENGFLPKHTNDVLRSWKQEEKIERISLDGQHAQGNYIEYNSPRLVGFRIKQSP